MIITIFGATGQVGLQLIHQALAKKYTVRAFGRNVESLIDKDLRDDNFIAIKGYVFDEKDVFNAIDGCNAVISCLGGGIDGLDKTRSLGTKNIITQMQKANVKRFTGIGGFGVLNSSIIDGLIMNEDEFPEIFKAVSLEHLQVWQQLQISPLEYSFICSPTIISDRNITQYITSKNFAPHPNSMVINSGNLAHCLLQSVIENSFVHNKIGICN